MSLTIERRVEYAIRDAIRAIEDRCEWAANGPRKAYFLVGDEKVIYATFKFAECSDRDSGPEGVVNALVEDVLSRIPEDVEYDACRPGVLWRLSTKIEARYQEDTGKWVAYSRLALIAADGELLVGYQGESTLKASVDALSKSDDTFKRQAADDVRVMGPGKPTWPGKMWMWYTDDLGKDHESLGDDERRKYHEVIRMHKERAALEVNTLLEAVGDYRRELKRAVSWLRSPSVRVSIDPAPVVVLADQLELRVQAVDEKISELLWGDPTIATEKRLECSIRPLTEEAIDEICQDLLDQGTPVFWVDPQDPGTWSKPHMVVIDDPHVPLDDAAREKYRGDLLKWFNEVYAGYPKAPEMEDEEDGPPDDLLGEVNRLRQERDAAYDLVADVHEELERCRDALKGDLRVQFSSAASQVAQRLSELLLEMEEAMLDAASYIVGIADGAQNGHAHNGHDEEGSEVGSGAGYDVVIVCPDSEVGWDTFEYINHIVLRRPAS